MNKRVYLRKGREASAERFHPWIFSGAIQRIDDGVEEGDIVDVYSHGGEYIGRGHYQIGSIAVRLLTFDDENIDETFWRNRLSAALTMREKAGISGCEGADAFRCQCGCRGKE